MRTPIHLYHANTVTYDLTIGDLHTYYVVAGETPVLVHNTSCGPINPIKVWRPGRSDTANSGQDPIPSGSWFTTAGDSLADGNYYFVVMRDGSVRAIDTDYMMSLADKPGHTSLAEGESVFFAGTFDVLDGNVVEIGNWSGHYAPHNVPGYASIESVAKEALVQGGFPGASDAWWNPMNQ